MQARLAKIAMLAALGFFAFLVTFGNVTDPAANMPFVRHVLSMDTTFRDPAMMYRAITAAPLQTAAFWAIVAGEAATCGLFGLAA